MKTRNSNRFVLMILFIAITACSPKKETKLIADIPICGTVQFSDGCSKELDEIISYGLALVHHMTYPEAEAVFDKVIETDAQCFWGPWGKALTYIHPVWPDEPSEEQMNTGFEMAQKALTLARSEKEIAYGNAVLAYYSLTAEKTKKERLVNFQEKWQLAYASSPNDMEAKSFYALSLIGTADPTDKTFANQLKAGALAEEVLQVIGDHPGGFHYVIHAYDYPGLSDKALQAANQYGKIAPEIPHALHMPSHIYTRLGMWKESIDWNTRSAAAAFDTLKTGSAVSMHYFHALDYLIYAYLQRGEDDKAIQLLEDMRKLVASFQISPVTAYALSAAESRLALERQDWKQAASLTLLKATDFPWNKFPEYEALTHFAVGLGAARTGLTDVADNALKRLTELQQLCKNKYWIGQMEIQKITVRAWIANSQGKKKEALDLMTLASDQEWATQKHPITPGDLLPARELLGDLLLELNQYNEALAQYELSLQRSPQRLNSVYGAALSAQLSNNAVKAKMYYEQLQSLTSSAETTFDKKQKATEYLKKSS